MRLRPKPKRSALKRHQVIAIVILLVVLFLLYRIKRSMSPGSTDSSFSANVEKLSQYATTSDELALLRSPELPSLLDSIQTQELGQTKISLIAKAKDGRTRSDLIVQVEPDATKRILLALLAKQKRTELGIVDVEDATQREAPSPIADPLANVVDVEARVLSDMSPGDRQVHMKHMSMDSENKYKPLPEWALEHMERDGANPLNRNCSKLYIPDHEGKFGGFTADCGWIIVASMYALSTGECAEFPALWGHGCDDDTREAGWTCFFKPIQERENGPSQLKKVETIKLRSASAEDRRMARRDYIYKPGFTGHRYARINDLIEEGSRAAGKGSFQLSPTADLVSWRLAFRWTFRPNDKVRAKLDELESRVLQGFRPEDIAGAHLRFGDKLGLKPGPREAYMVYQVHDFAQRLALYYSERKEKFPKAVFVATDDYNASVELGKILGPSVTVLTSADPVKDTGFSIVEYRNQWTSKAKFEAALRLWADMEILARTDMALLSFQSNIGRTVTLMRWDKPASSVISVDPTGPRCSAQNRADQLRSHQFWLCP